MSSSKLWLSLVVCVVACGGSSFHSGDASGGSGGTGDTSAGGDTTTSGGQLGSSGNTSHAGTSSQAGGTSSGGSTSSGGDTSAAGTTVSAGGDLSVGGDVAVGGGSDGGGVNGGGIGGTSAGSGGTGGTVDCSATGDLWKNYVALVDKAKVCSVQVDGQCTANSNIVTQANCPIPVNSKSEYYDEARKALEAWKSAGCTFKITMCQAQVGTLGCQPNSDGTAITGTCGYAPIVAQ